MILLKNYEVLRPWIYTLRIASTTKLQLTAHNYLSIPYKLHPTINPKYTISNKLAFLLHSGKWFIIIGLGVYDAHVVACPSTLALMLRRDYYHHCIFIGPHVYITGSENINTSMK